MTDKRLEKIVALLAQAEKTTFPEEAKAFSAKAQSLMSEWSIDEAQLAQAREDAGQKQDIPSDEQIWMPGTMYKNAMATLWNAVCEANHVKLVLVPGQKFYENWKKEGYTRPYIRGAYFHLFGFEGDITRTKLLATSLTIQMENEFRSPETQSILNFETRTGPAKVQWKNGFILGYVRSVRTRLLEAASHAAGTALVLVRRDELVAKSVSDRYSKLGKSSSTAGQGYNSSRALGREAGARADVGNTRLGGDNNRKVLR